MYDVYRRYEYVFPPPYFHSLLNQNTVSDRLIFVCICVIQGQGSLALLRTILVPKSLFAFSFFLALVSLTSSPLLFPIYL